MGALRESGLTLKLADDRRRLLASFRPAKVLGEADLGLLRGELAEQFPDLFIFEQLLPQAINKIRAGEAFEITIGEVRDGEVQVHLDASKMAAYLHILPPFGGAPVTREQVGSAIERAGVVFGLDHEVVEQSIQAGRADNVLIAKGRQPVYGEDGRLESLIPSMKERRPRLDEHGLANYRNLGEVLVVHTGETLVRRVPATPGEAGETLLGQEIPAIPGKDVMFASGLTGVAPDTSDPDVLVAAITGQPVQVKNGVIVEPTYTASSVDLSTGNIVFDGTVKVQGDVQAGMCIRATGDIHVAGTVEAATQGEATLEAGGDIVVQGGVIGRADSGSGESHVSHLHCKGSFTARFVQNVQIFAEDSIYIDDTAMHSDLSAANQVVVGKEGSGKGKGRIIGGLTQATLLVKAQVIGSPSLTKTVVEVGFHPKMNDRLRLLASEREEWDKKLEDVQRVLAFAKLNPGKLSEETLQKAEKTLVSAQARIAELQDEHEILNGQLRLSDKGRVVVEKTLYEGVEVMSGGQRYKAVAERGAGVFCLREGELVYDDLPR
ncbi:MAG: FapA family protein [Sulfuricella sp.]|nr:FapA family protein [Sulfuricella sp.]